MLAKVFPIKLKDGNQAVAEQIVQEFAPKGPGTEEGTLSFRVYRDPANPDYLLFVEHFANQAAYDAHTGSAAYKELIARAEPASQAFGRTSGGCAWGARSRRARSACVLTG